MGDAAAYLRDTLREREAELTRTIQLVADLTTKLAEKDARIAWLQTREDWWRGEWDTGQREIDRLEACVNGLRDEVVRLTEKDAEQIFALNAQMADLKAALTTEQQAREHDAVAADNALAEKDELIVNLRAEKIGAYVQLAEKDAQIREWETGAVAASTEIVKLRRHAENDRGLRISYRETLEAISAALKVDIERTTDRGAILEALAALQQQLQETRESFEAVVRAAGPFMPPVPESTE